MLGTKTKLSAFLPCEIKPDIFCIACIWKEHQWVSSLPASPTEEIALRFEPVALNSCPHLLASYHALALGYKVSGG